MSVGMIQGLEQPIWALVWCETKIKRYNGSKQIKMESVEVEGLYQCN